MKVLIVGYTYTRTNLIEVFDSYPDKQNLFFILPNNWQAKNGTVKFKPFRRTGLNIYNSRAFFFHSNYPIIGGLFKGWMPFFIFRLLWLRIFKGVGIMFSTGEPNQLSTTYNALWAKLLGMKFAFNYWENISYEQKDSGIKLKIKKIIVKINVRLSDGAICGMHKAESILRTFSNKIKIGTFLHAGFDVNRFNPDVEPKMRRELGLDGKTVFLFVGALGYRKGIHLVFEALKQLNQKYNDLFFLVIGSGEYESALKKRADELGLGNMVKFIPWLPNEDLPSIYTSSDVFVYPSIPYQGWEEQFGYSIAEASLCNLPVISTNTGSIYEVLLDGETGLMVPPDNVDQLRNAMEKLILNKDLRVSLGNRGREYIKNNFSNEVISGKIYNFFKAL